MPFVTSWDETKPAGTRNLNLGDDDIREFKTQVRERLAVDHHAVASEAGDSEVGYHEKLTLIDQSSDPLAVSDALILYSKLVSGDAELYSRHETAGIQQLSRSGKLWIEALGIASQAQGDIIKFNGTIWTRLAKGTANQLIRVNAGATDLEYFTSTFTTTGDYATNAEVKTGTATDKIVAPGTMVSHEGVAKAWVKFNGSGTVTINDSFNVTSITDNGTGDYTVNFTTAFATGHYAFAGMCGPAASSAQITSIFIKESTTPGSTSIIIITANENATRTDYAHVGFIAIGDR